MSTGIAKSVVHIRRLIPFKRFLLKKLVCFCVLKFKLKFKFLYFHISGQVLVDVLVDDFNLTFFVYVKSYKFSLLIIQKQYKLYKPQNGHNTK